MKFKKITVPKFQYQDAFGEHIFSDVSIVINLDEQEISPENFDQDAHEFYLEDEESKRMACDSVYRFLNKNALSILKGDQAFSGDQLKALISFLRVNRSEFSDLIGLDKSSITRMINENQSIKKDVLWTILDLLKEEVESLGRARRVLEQIRKKEVYEKVSSLNLDPEKVAEYFIRFFDKNSDNLTNLKLQKILYYAKGIGLGRYSIKLFEERFLAWEHGPVLHSVYQKYKVLGAALISADNDIDLSPLLENQQDALKVMQETISQYGKYSAWALRNKTHNESPWTDTKRNDPIDDDAIRNFFKNNLN